MMSIDPVVSVVLVSTLIAGLAIGTLVGWLAARPARARLQADLERDRAVHIERLKAYQDAESKLRDAFSTLSGEALKRNNEQFLSLAQTKLQQARAEATADIDSRRKAIEDLLVPMAKTLEQVDRDIKESERRRIETGAALIEKIAAQIGRAHV